MCHCYYGGYEIYARQKANKIRLFYHRHTLEH